MKNYKELTNNSRIPLIGNFELTRKCGFNCVICYNERRNDSEMKTHEIKALIDELADMGCLYINLTGGDPLIREDFCEIYKYVLKKGIIPAVETGLTRLTKDQIEVFKEYNPEKLLVSIYAMDDDVLENVTCSNVRSQYILENILKLKRENIPFELRTPFTKLNIAHAGKIAKFARENGIPYKCTTKIFWKQNGERCDDLRCLPEDISPFINEDEIYHKLYREACYLAENTPQKKDCCTGIYDFNITPYGTLNFCITFWKPEYDLKNGSFRDAWENWYPLFRRQEDNYCLGKKLYSDNAEVCPYGKIYKNKEFNCAIGLDVHAKQRMEELKKSGHSKAMIINEMEITEELYNKLEQL